MPISDVTDLNIYNQAMAVLPDVYRLCACVPEQKLRNQLQSSARSISANIHEGFGRRKSVKEFKRFLLIAMASSDESITHLRHAKMIYGSDCDDLIKSFKDISSRINRTISNWS